MRSGIGLGRVQCEQGRRGPKACWSFSHQIGPASKGAATCFRHGAPIRGLSPFNSESSPITTRSHSSRRSPGRFVLWHLDDDGTADLAVLADSRILAQESAPTMPAAEATVGDLADEDTGRVAHDGLADQDIEGCQWICHYASTVRMLLRSTVSARTRRAQSRRYGLSQSWSSWTAASACRIMAAHGGSMDSLTAAEAGVSTT